VVPGALGTGYAVGGTVGRAPRDRDLKSFVAELEDSMAKSE